MDPIVQTLVSVLLAVIASSGFWTFMQKRADKKDAKTELLIGMATIASCIFADATSNGAGSRRTSTKIFVPTYMTPTRKMAGTARQSGI